MKRDTPPNWRKIFWLIALLLIVAYAFGEQHLERWLGVDLPSIRDQGNVATDDPNVVADSSTTPDWTRRADQQFPPPEEPISIHGTKKRVEQNAATATPFLTPTGKNDRLQSPAGLVYGVGGGGEHRVDHVMRHARDDLSRDDTHSVFDGGRQEILQLLDEAFLLIKSESRRVHSQRDAQRDFRVEYEIDMQRRIGYLGGRRGQRQNHPPRSKIKLILDNDKFVVTAYPTN